MRARGIPAVHLVAWLVVFSAVVAAAQSPRPSAPTPPRDTGAQRSATPDTPTGALNGKVLSADNGRPISRVRVFITAPELSQGRGVLTDADGAFEFTGLPDGRYTVTASKTGFITLAYGQRRPLQPGTPLQIVNGQELKGIGFRLPRGSAIAGRVFDENGDPMAGTVVQVLRYDNAQGNRQLVPAGTAQTDDRGLYRVWGLNPGDYYVSAAAQANGRGLPFGPVGGQAGFGRGGPTGNDETGYAPTYYPGVPSANEARPVNVALGAEVLDINFNVLLVRTARVTGRVVNSDGSSTWSGNVNLAPDGEATRNGPFGANYGARVQADGNFSVNNVPPGRYTLRVRSTMRDEPAEFASMPVTLNGADVNVNVALAPGASVSGTITLESTQSGTLPDLTQFRISLPPVDPGDAGPQSSTRATKDATFSLDAVPEGLHWVRGQAPRGWTLKSVIADGRDTVDTPIETPSGKSIKAVTVVFTDRLTQIAGTLTNQLGQPVTEYTMLAFSTDSTLWRPLSRQIMTTRPDQNGAFQIRGLPPGEYFLTAIDPSEPGEWFAPAFLDQHRPGATRLTIGEGESKTQDFKVTIR